MKACICWASIVNTIEPYVVRHARTENDVTPIIGRAIARKNNSDFVTSGEIIAPAIVSRHDSELEFNVFCVLVLMESLIGMLVDTRVGVKLNGKILEETHSILSQVTISMHVLLESDLRVVNVQLCVSRWLSGRRYER